MELSMCCLAELVTLGGVLDYKCVCLKMYSPCLMTCMIKNFFFFFFWECKPLLTTLYFSIWISFLSCFSSIEWWWSCVWGGREYELVELATLSPLKTAGPVEWSHLLFKIARTDLNKRCDGENRCYLDDTKHY